MIITITILRKLSEANFGLKKLGLLRRMSPNVPSLLSNKNKEICLKGMSSEITEDHTVLLKWTFYEAATL
jgi:hypothetical protein